MVKYSWNGIVSTIVTFVTLWHNVTGSGSYQGLFNSTSTDSTHRPTIVTTDASQDSGYNWGGSALVLLPTIHHIEVLWPENLLKNHPKLQELKNQEPGMSSQKSISSSSYSFH